MSETAPVPAKAAELTPKEQQEQIDSAFYLERLIKAHKQTIEGSWWDLAKALFEFHEMRGWELLGHDTLIDFLAQPDLGLSERSYHYAVRLWRDLVEVRQLPPSDLKEIPHTKVREVVPAIMSGSVTPKQALSDAKELSHLDVKEKYRPENIARTGQAPDNSTELDASTEPKRVKCPSCRTWVTEDKLPAAAGGSRDIPGKAKEKTDGSSNG